jgi:hypothetical protein
MTCRVSAGTEAPFVGRTARIRGLEAPVREFLRTETGGAAVLVAAIVVALVWVNVDRSSYESAWSTTLSIRIGGSAIAMDLRQWVNEGLMAFFFLVVGLEARREFDLGEFRERNRVVLPVLAGCGGMLGAIGIYLALNAGRDSAHGWGTAMSTDTAFALGVLALVGKRVPDRLRGFLLTVVVVDDLLALLVIAVVYSDEVQWQKFWISVGFFAGIVLLALARLRLGLLVFALGVASCGDAEVRHRSAGRRAGCRAARLRRPGLPQRPGAGHRDLPRLPRAAHPAATARGVGGVELLGVPQRPAAAALPPVDVLRAGAAVRAGERRHPPGHGLHR